MPAIATISPIPNRRHLHDPRTALPFRVGTPTTGDPTRGLLVRLLIIYLLFRQPCSQQKNFRFGGSFSMSLQSIGRRGKSEDKMFAEDIVRIYNSRLLVFMLLICTENYLGLRISFFLYQRFLNIIFKYFSKRLSKNNILTALKILFDTPRHDEHPEIFRGTAPKRR